jgi:hypothetical protein
LSRAAYIRSMGISSDLRFEPKESNFLKDKALTGNGLRFFDSMT